MEDGRYVLRLEGFSDMLESSDETAVDSLEPELIEIASHEISIPELEQSEDLTDEKPILLLHDSSQQQQQQQQQETAEEEIYLRRPNFRVDVESDADLDSELLMTSEEADSLLSSR